MGLKASVRLAMEARTTGSARRLRDAGLALIRRGNLAGAINKLGEALAVAPGDPVTLYHLATTADRLGMTDGAIRFYEQILAGDPDRIEILVKLSQAYRCGARPDAATALLKDALARHAGEASLWHALGSTLRETGDRASARSFFDEAVRLAPDHAAAWASLADLDLEAGDLDTALSRYDKARRLVGKTDSLRPQITLSHALALLQAGRLAEGWKAYDARFKAQRLTYTHRLKAWTGQPLKGRPLLICAEQGVGDQLMFASLVPEIADRAAAAGSPVALECDPRLVPLLARRLGSVEVRPATFEEIAGDRRSRHDALAPGTGYWAIPLGGLPAQVWPDGAVPRETSAFLRPDPQEAEQWRRWLDRLPAPRTGLCWRSGKGGGLRTDFYAPLDRWIGLARTLPGAIVCVQYDVTEAERAAFAAAGVMLHVPPGLDQKQDIDRATALLAGLDRVITAPTAVAYQAALAGTPAHRLMAVAPWTSLGGARDAFAPGLADHVARSPGDWAPLFEDVRAVLSRTGIDTG